MSKVSVALFQRHAFHFQICIHMLSRHTCMQLLCSRNRRLTSALTASGYYLRHGRRIPCCRDMEHRRLDDQQRDCEERWRMRSLAAEHTQCERKELCCFLVEIQSSLHIFIRLVWLTVTMWLLALDMPHYDSPTRTDDAPTAATAPTSISTKSSHVVAAEAYSASLSLVVLKSTMLILLATVTMRVSKTSKLIDRG